MSPLTVRCQAATGSGRPVPETPGLCFAPGLYSAPALSRPGAGHRGVCFAPGLYSVPVRCRVGRSLVTGGDRPIQTRLVTESFGSAVRAGTVGAWHGHQTRPSAQTPGLERPGTALPGHFDHRLINFHPLLQSDV